MEEEKFNLKEEYNKYKLPKFEDLDKQFEISGLSLKDKNFLLQKIRRRVNEKVIFYSKIIEEIIYPNPNNYIAMQELKDFSQEEKIYLSQIHKNLMRYERESLSIDVNPNDKKDVEYINNLWQDWLNFKKELIKVTDRLKDSWKYQKDKKREDSYFG